MLSRLKSIYRSQVRRSKIGIQETLRDEDLRTAAEGVTTLKEFIRVTQDAEWL
jgi:type II secretory ATPase GspE/PulE/Tfp pilus assembly ATPase PilB-like protein